MALISAKTILTSLSLFHITLGFFFLTNPLTIADQALVYIVGEAMGLPHARDFETHSPALAFLGVVLAILGLCDLVTLSLPEEMSLVHHWGLQAPLRLLLSILLVFYTYAFSASSPLYHQSPGTAPPSARPAPASTGATTAAGTNYVPSTWGGDALKNRVFFTFMFVEMVSWFWVWVTLREERGPVLARGLSARRRASASRRGSGEY